MAHKVKKNTCFLLEMHSNQGRNLCVCVRVCVFGESCTEYNDFREEAISDIIIIKLAVIRITEEDGDRWTRTKSTASSCFIV